MRNKKQLWEVLQNEYEEDLLNTNEESHCICDVISESENLEEDEKNFLLYEMKLFGLENGFVISLPFWKIEDIETRRNFINEKIKNYPNE